MKTSRSGFTLIELLVVIAIIAILSVVLILTLNPADLLRQARDVNRLSSLTTLNNAAQFAQVKGLSLGTPNVVYISIPDKTLLGNATSTCSSLGLPALPVGYTYQCVSPQNISNTDGTGWMPINFNSLSSGSPLATLSIDATNNTSTYLFYAYMTNGTQYELTSHEESAKYAPTGWVDGGEYSDLQEIGSNLKLIPVDLGGGNLYVAGEVVNYITDFSDNGTQRLKIGSPGTGDGQFSSPGAMATDQAGNLYVADGNEGSQFVRVEEFDPNGKFLMKFGSYGSSTGQFLGVGGIAFDAHGDIYITDTKDNRVEKFSQNGQYLSQFGSSGSGNGQFNLIAGIAIDPQGNIYVGDEQNYRVQKFDSSGNYISQFGSYGSGNGQFINPSSVAIDSQGNIYVMDSGNYRIQEFSSSTQTYVSQLGSKGCFADAQFCGSGDPISIGVDRSGNLFAIDPGGFRMEEWNASGTFVSQFNIGNWVPYFMAVQQ